MISLTSTTEAKQSILVLLLIISLFMHARIDFTLFATVSCWSETAPYDPDPFQTAVFQGRVSDYTSPNLLSGSHMHNFAFGCSKRLFIPTCLICQVIEPALYKCFPFIITISPGFMYLHVLSPVSLQLFTVMIKVLNKTEARTY